MPATLPVKFEIANARHGSALRAFLHRLSPATIQARYIRPWTHLPRSVAEAETVRMLDRDPARHVVLLAIADEDVRGIGEFILEASGEANIALTVEDAYQHRGIGALLYAQLEQLAGLRGLNAFIGEVAYSNLRVLQILRRSGRLLRTRFDGTLVRFNIAIQPRQ